MLYVPQFYIVYHAFLHFVNLMFGICKYKCLKTV